MDSNTPNLSAPSPRPSQAVPAAFFRVEGALLKPARMPAPAWFTLNAQSMQTRLSRLGGLALTTGLKLGGPLKDQHLIHRMAWMGLKDMGLDRLEVLAEEYRDKFIQPNLKSVGIGLVKEARRLGYKIVLLSDNIDVVMRPLANELQADLLIANRPELRGDASRHEARCTGRLAAPIIGGNLSGQWLRDLASRHDFDLSQSLAYGAFGADSMLLSSVGRPCAVTPDFRLRRVARDLDWPVLEA